MTGAGAAYRLALAERSLEAAEDSFARSRWRDAALFARAAAEHLVIARRIGAIAKACVAA